MKQKLLSVLLIAPAISFAQTTVFTENFDSYNDGDWAAVVSPIMDSWNGTTGAPPDCQVTNAESNSAPNAIDINGPVGGGTIDALVIFPSDYTSGAYLYSMKMKVAAGNGAYINAQASSTPGVAWMCEVYFLQNGTGYVLGGGDSISFTYTNDAWIDVEIRANLDVDSGEVFIEGTSVSTFSWSQSWGAVNLYSAAGDNESCQYWVDDISLEQCIFSTATSTNGATITADMSGAAYQWIDCNTMSPIAGETGQSFTTTANGSYAVIIDGCGTIDTSACVDICIFSTATSTNGAIITADMSGAAYQWIDCNTMSPIAGETGQSLTTTTDGSYAVIIDGCGTVDTSACVDMTYWGVETQDLNPDINVVPNPTTGNFTITYADMNMSNARVVIVDVLGSIVYQSNASVIGNGSLDFNLNLDNGVYFVTFKEGNAKLTKRVVVRK